MPDAYDPKYKRWVDEDLPILPNRFKTRVIPSSINQFKIVQNLINDKRIDTIICATDSGREGELIFRLVYDKVGTHKPFLRLWTSSTEEDAIMEAFRNLKDGHEYDNLASSAEARQEADWLIGMNLSRLVTLRNGNTKFAVGRVQTPTLNLIYNRNQEILNFKPEKYNALKVKVNANNNLIKFESDRIEPDEANSMLNSLGDSLLIKRIETNGKSEKAPKLLDLTTLQRLANKLYGISAKETLDIAQKLYELGYISYPRTDSKFITDDMEGKVEKLIGDYVNDPYFDNIKKIINNSKVTDHTALLPTEKSVNSKELIGELSEKYSNIYNLIYMQLLKSVSKEYKYLQTKIMATCGSVELFAGGNKTIDLGFKNLDKNNSQDVHNLDGLNEGDFLELIDKELLDKVTRPPSQYNEDSLLEKMDNAGKGQYDADIERKGLGTTATRADVIEGLIKNKYIVRKKKQLLITDLGESLINHAPKELKEVDLTVDWENKLANIAKGNLSKEIFLNEIKNYLSEVTSTYKGDDRLNTGESIGRCPFCGGNVYMNLKAINCENSKYGKNKGSCKFGTSRTIAGHYLTEEESTKLVNDGVTNLIKNFKSKNGKNFPARVAIDEDGNYPTKLLYDQDSHIR